MTAFVSGPVLCEIFFFKNINVAQLITTGELKTNHTCCKRHWIKDNFIDNKFVVIKTLTTRADRNGRSGTQDKSLENIAGRVDAININ